jgi:uncharacterized protein (TIGR02145 family)
MYYMKNQYSLFVFFVVLINQYFSQTVTIGDQVWMTKNLDVLTFRNGDPIPEAKTDEDWIKAGKEGKPVWCYYDNNLKNGGKYGKLYNWYAVSDKRGLAPEDWHVPNDVEWITCIDYLGGESNYITGMTTEGEKMKSASGWNGYNIDGSKSYSGNGSNESGFAGLPGGYRNADGSFNEVGSVGYWWSSSKFDEDSALFCKLGSYFSNAYWFNNYMSYGFSVRCLKN